MNHGLTPKQRRFIEEYFKDLNPSQAMLRAGYAKPEPGRLMANPQVRRVIEERTARRLARHEATADNVIAELARVAFADVRDLMEWGPDGAVPRESRELSPDAAAAVAEVSVNRGSVKVRKYDKIKALELLGRWLGLFTDRLQAEVSGPGGEALEPGRRIVVEFVPTGRDGHKLAESEDQPARKMLEQGSLIEASTTSEDIV